MMCLFYKIIQLGLILLLGIGIGLAQDLPDGWLAEDVGEPALEGSAMFSNDSFYVTAGGSDIWNANDEFHFVYRIFEGDGYIQAKVDSLVTTSNEWAKAGVMMREEIGGGSPFAMTVNTRDFSCEMQQRFLFDENMNSGTYNYRPDDLLTLVNCGHRWDIWVKLVREDDEFTGFYSLDTLVDSTGARIWNEIAMKQITEMTPGVTFAGLMVTSHNAAALCDAVFTEVAYGDLSTGVDEELPAMMVQDFVLRENYPNPFNPSTTIPYEVNKAGAVKITIYDLLGREVTQLVNKFHSPGSYTATWSAQSGVSSGIYFYNLEAGNYQSQMMKMVMIK
jgi:hypothetical protein